MYPINVNQQSSGFIPTAIYCICSLNQQEVVQYVLEVSPRLLGLLLGSPFGVDWLFLEHVSQFLAETDDLADQVEHPVGFALVNQYFFLQHTNVSF